MNILDINTLPTLTLNVTGREGSGTSVTIINQESKDSIQSSDFTYTQGETLVVSIDNQDFLDSIEKNTTLSVIIYQDRIPLYRDVVRFRGELDVDNEYIQYNNDDDYFVYEGVQYDEDDEQISYGGEGDLSGSQTGTSTSVTYVGSVPEGMNPLTLEEDEVVENDYSVTYDLNNDGRGEMSTGSNYKYLQSLEQTYGDFKVRSAQYGVFNDSPTSLEAVSVYQYGFNSNTGNTYGYHPDAQPLSNNPDLVNTLERDFGGSVGSRKYFHFRNGRDESFNETVRTLQMRDENSLDNSVFETTIYKEDSISDWTVGMSIYSDVAGNSITDSYVDSYANVNDLDRYHFISKNASGVWTLVRCTDGVVTHVEAVDDTNYIRFSEMYSVSILNKPYEQKPKGRLATTKAWVESKLADPEAVFQSSSTPLDYTTVKFNISTISYNRDTKRAALDLSGGELGAIGTRIYSSTGPLNIGRVFHKQLIYQEADSSLLEASDEDRYTFKLLANSRDYLNNLLFNEQPWLILEIDKATGLISDRAWITPQ